MRSKRLSKIPLRSGLYLFGGSVGVLLMILVGLRPIQTSISQMDEEIALLRDRLAQQKQLAPLYHELEKQLMREDSAILPTGKSSALDVDQVGEIPHPFRKMAQECGLEAVSVAPDAKLLTKDRKAMPVNLTLKGEFLGLRKFLLGMEKLPYLQHTEEIQILDISGSKEIRIRTWVAVSSQKSQ